MQPANTQRPNNLPPFVLRHAYAPCARLAHADCCLSSSTLSCAPGGNRLITNLNTHSVPARWLRPALRPLLLHTSPASPAVTVTPPPLVAPWARRSSRSCTSTWPSLRAEPGVRGLCGRAPAASVCTAQAHAAIRPSVLRAYRPPQLTRVLPSDEAAIHNDVLAPVVRALKISPQLLQLCLQHKVDQLQAYACTCVRRQRACSVGGVSTQG
jgi:hypothetical protein